MIRQLWSAAVPSARLVSPSTAITSASSKSALAAPSVWHQLTKPTIPLSRSNNNARYLSTTPRTAFTTSRASYTPSPFRLASNKSTSSPSASSEEYYSPYKPKRQWPPDMSKLSPKHQFRLERKYRRRAALKYARPKFIKTVTLAQWIIIGFVAVYAVLFMNWDTRETPFDGIRESFFSAIRTVFSSPAPPGPVKGSDERSAADSRAEDSQ